MKKNLAGALVIAAIFALGFFAGHRGVHPRESRPGTAPLDAMVNLPPIGELPKTTAPETPSGSMWLAEAESAVIAARASQSDRIYEDIWRIAEVIRAEDIPEFVHFLEAGPNRRLQYFMSQVLLKRWANVDPRAAMAYASSIAIADLRNANIRGDPARYLMIPMRFMMK